MKNAAVFYLRYDSDPPCQNRLIPTAVFRRILTKQVDFWEKNVYNKAKPTEEARAGSPDLFVFQKVLYCPVLIRYLSRFFPKTML